MTCRTIVEILAHCLEAVSPGHRKVSGDVSDQPVGLFMRSNQKEKNHERTAEVTLAMENKT